MLARVPAAATTLLLLLVSTTSRGGIDVASRTDPAVDFSAYRSFAWTDGRPAENPEAERLIGSAVERELTSRGVRRVEDEAELLVATYTLIDRHSLDELDDEDAWEFWTGVTEMRARSVGGGTVVVDLIDPRTRRVVWRGLAAGTVASDARKTVRRLDKALARLLERLPWPVR